jgi:hypothetical protein
MLLKSYDFDSSLSVGGKLRTFLYCVHAAGLLGLKVSASETHVRQGRISSSLFSY